MYVCLFLLLLQKKEVKNKKTAIYTNRLRTRGGMLQINQRTPIVVLT